ncbi:hypothetical protein STXM2123_5383 [Streptomyces sp. F-3]|nr:hypothetical protein STXM2123_5383 [Streptomyces sp. F-3]
MLFAGPHVLHHAALLSRVSRVLWILRIPLRVLRISPRGSWVSRASRTSWTSQESWNAPSPDPGSRRGHQACPVGPGSAGRWSWAAKAPFRGAGTRVPHCFDPDASLLRPPESCRGRGGNGHGPHLPVGPGRPSAAGGSERGGCRRGHQDSWRTPCALGPHATRSRRLSALPATAVRPGANRDLCGNPRGARLPAARSRQRTGAKNCRAPQKRARSGR